MLLSELMGKPKLAPKVSGRIRPGIMVLTKRGSENKDARRIYDEGVARGDSFEDIADQIKKKTGEQGLMRPVNPPYFTVRRGDFGSPEIADFILERYGEVREDGVKRLYRLPVAFASDEVTQILDFRFQMYTSQGLVYWSDESSDGKSRQCMTRAPLEVDPTTRKVVRLSSSRPVIPRPDNGGVCIPERCREFQSNQCNLRGRVLFAIPGVPGGGLIELPTGSKNFGFESEALLAGIREMTGGKLMGLGPGDRPVFYLTKKLKSVPMIDTEKGKATRADQWIIEIESTLDMSVLISARGTQAQALSTNADRAAQVLIGRSPDPAGAPASATSQSGMPAATDQKPQGAASVGGSAAGSASRSAAGDGSESAIELTAKRREIKQAIEAAGYDVNAFNAWAQQAIGENWGRDPAGLDKAAQTLAYNTKQLGMLPAALQELGVDADQFDAWARTTISPQWRLIPGSLAAIHERLLAAYGDPARFTEEVASVASAASAASAAAQADAPGSTDAAAAQAHGTEKAEKAGKAEKAAHADKARPMAVRQADVTDVEARPAGSTRNSPAPATQAA